MTQYWKSALAGAAVVILSATAAAGTASARELPGMPKTTASAPADRQGDCIGYVSIRHDRRSGYEISYGGSSRGWSPRGFLRITAVLMVNGQREGSVSGTTRNGRNVDTPTGTDFRRSIRSATVSVRAYGPAGSVSCRRTTRM
jgi:hypothetical protein